MVSFFGLKFGGDKKKGLQKGSITKPNDDWKTRPQDKIQQEPTGGTSANFSRPGRPKSRAGTSYSHHGQNSDWRAPFKMGAGLSQGANSSMVDLSAPSMPSLSNLRHQWSDLHLNETSKTWDVGTTAADFNAMSEDDGGHVSITSRSATSSLRDVPKSFDAQSVRLSASGSNRPGTPTNANLMATKSPLGQFEFGLGEPSPAANLEDDDPIIHENTLQGTPSQHGYPSPPPSIEIGNSERSFSPIQGDARPRNATSALRRVDTTGSRSLPSPVASIIRSSEDSKWDGPIIRSVQAKRDTLTMYSPRRQSFTMEMSEPERQEFERRTTEERQTGGFGVVTGNVSAFDFGESVRNSAAPSLALNRQGSDSSRGVERSSSSTGSITAQRAEISSRSEGPRRTESPLGLRKVSMEERRTAKERGMSEPMTNDTIEDEDEHEIDSLDSANDNHIQGQPQSSELHVAVPPPPAAPKRTGRPTAAAGIHPGANMTRQMWEFPKVQSQPAFNAAVPLYDNMPIQPPSQPRSRNDSTASTFSIPGGALRLQKPAATETSAKEAKQQRAPDAALGQMQNIPSASLNDKDHYSSRRVDAPIPQLRAGARSEAAPPIRGSSLPKSTISDRVANSSSAASPSRSIDKIIPNPIQLPPPNDLQAQTADTSATIPSNQATQKFPPASMPTSPRSPYGPSVDDDSYTVPARAAPAPPNVRPTTAIAHPQPVSEPYSPGSGFSKGQGRLPRGRRIPPPGALSLDPNVRKSALVAPLSPTKLSLAPRIPSPTFLSLGKTLDNDDDWGRSFELSFDQVQGTGSPGGDVGSLSASLRRVEASRAPPRSPLPSIGRNEREKEKIALAEFGNGNSDNVAKEFAAGFI